MPERGARPRVRRLQRTALKAVRAFSSPLLPEDYLQLINLQWSTRELRGKVESVDGLVEPAEGLGHHLDVEFPGTVDLEAPHPFRGRSHRG